ncbi:hypothetical protein J0H58_19850 [bacterium]|nr:hypothetical protein [bacterium]
MNEFEFDAPRPHEVRHHYARGSYRPGGGSPLWWVCGGVFLVVVLLVVWGVVTYRNAEIDYRAEKLREGYERLEARREALDRRKRDIEVHYSDNANLRYEASKKLEREYEAIAQEADQMLRKYGRSRR